MEQSSDYETEGEVSMTAKETKRLIEWMTRNGHTYEEACNCIAYVADGTELPKEQTEKAEET